ncbi:hypothetical protein RhiirC2_855509 [Rhizophagus irregularis]|uniref:Uncharacterized protein n=1 Tax=Rhizophagus irregularis TaxID=588596 RepID=A0A2N1MM11_9GLOM|nr:hypothetical protein RhiirC2_855509 [Rhizophagus irregularis]
MFFMFAGRRLLGIRRTVLYRQVRYQSFGFGLQTLASQTLVGFLNIGVFFCRSTSLNKLESSSRFGSASQISFKVVLPGHDDTMELVRWSIELVFKGFN